MSHGSSDAVAIDVVLIPPPALDQYLRALNTHLAPPPEGFRFDETHLPHVTLVQLLVLRDRLEEMATAIEDVLGTQRALALHTTSITHGPAVSTLGVAPSPALDLLHRQLARRLDPFAVALPPDGSRDSYDAFVDSGEPARPSDLEWVRRFRERSAYDRFDPHWTLGVGRLDISVEPMAFAADRVALCHLGRFCTCRKTLDWWTLASNPYE